MVSVGEKDGTGYNFESLSVLPNCGSIVRIMDSGVTVVELRAEASDFTLSGAEACVSRLLNKALSDYKKVRGDC